MTASPLQALILAGGRGTRFWPRSRRAEPKQFLSLVGDHSLLRHTADRLGPLVAPGDLWVCTTADLAERAAAELPELAAERILSEPVGRNTGPAIAWALRSMPEPARQGVVIVLPSDHWVADPTAFREAVEVAVRCVEDNEAVVTFGVPPRWPETGFGYVQIDQDASGAPRPILARGFVEKPDPPTAEAFVRGGRHLWNAGIFVFRGTTLLAEIDRRWPELADGLERWAAAPTPEHRAAIYAALPAQSIDIGIMEKLDCLYTVPLDCGWSDLGSWTALAEVLGQAASGNCQDGDVVEVGGHDNLLIADSGTIAVLGVEGLVVVRTRDAVLVVPKARAQELRLLVAELERRGRDDLL